MAVTLEQNVGTIEVEMAKIPPKNLGNTAKTCKVAGSIPIARSNFSQKPLKNGVF
jgi:hypothetical protein